MPIVQFHLVETAHDADAVAALLKAASHFYAATLDPELDPLPLERVRAFVSEVPPHLWATAGKLVSEGGLPAPYFTCLALAGRPTEQLSRLMTGMTALIAEHLGVERSLVRGMLIPIDPAHWFIGGQSASLARKSEVEARSRGQRARVGKINA
jgi:phenylpyruvate tautomerase PptA (4-oxalocrotonate tautomerase family)